MRNIKLTLAYNGKNYFGFQIQPGIPTVQAKLQEVIKIILKEDIKVTAAGRTDRGVHAEGQVVNLKTSSTIDLRRLKWSLNAVLPGDIVVKEAEEVPVSFDARRDAKRRRYRYLILNRDHGDLFKGETVHFEARPLDFEAIRSVGPSFLGSHNFSAFTTGKGWRQDSYIKSISLFDIRKDESGLIEVIIEADAFLYHMVRFIVGSLIQLGLGAISGAKIEDMLSGKARAVYLAPANGLTLLSISYD